MKDRPITAADARQFFGELTDHWFSEGQAMFWLGFVVHGWNVLVKGVVVRPVDLRLFLWKMYPDGKK